MKTIRNDISMGAILQAQKQEYDLQARLLPNDENAQAMAKLHADYTKQSAEMRHAYP